jgi:hypothetical protein
LQDRSCFFIFLTLLLCSYYVIILFFRSTYGTVYQVPGSILSKLSPIVCHSTRSDHVLITSETFETNSEILIPVDSSIKSLFIEVTGPGIDYISVRSPAGEILYPSLDLEVDFGSLKYYAFHNISVGNWVFALHSADIREFHLTASAQSFINFQSTLNSNMEFSAHSFHNDIGHSLTIAGDTHQLKSGSNFISSTKMSDSQPMGEFSVTFETNFGHLKRMRRATKPLFVPVSKTDNLTAGRTNVLFYRAENEGQELTFGVTSTISTWTVTVSPQDSLSMAAYTDIEISIVVPYHAKAGTEGTISLSASDGKTIVGSTTFSVSIAEAIPPTTKSIKVQTSIVNRFATTVFTAVAENHQASMGDAPFRAIIPSKAFIRSLNIITAEGKVYKSKIIPAFQQGFEPDARLKFAMGQPQEPLSPEELKSAESETPFHHTQTQQEVMLVDTVDAGDHRIVQVKQFGQHLVVRASVEAFSNLTYVLEYVEVLERNRGLYRYGVHFDPDYTAAELSVRELKIEDYFLITQK